MLIGQGKVHPPWPMPGYECKDKASPSDVSLQEPGDYL
jgi:hypothetical protein